MELILAILGAGTTGYFSPTRRRALTIYLGLWAVVFPIQTIVVFSEDDGKDTLYWVFNALILGAGIGLNQLGRALAERRRTRLGGGRCGMTRRIALGLALAAAAAGAIAIPTVTAAQSTGARDITVREKVTWVRFLHQRTSTRGDRMLTGDRVLTYQRLYDESAKRIGTLYTDCVNVGSAAHVYKATLLCTASYRLGQGQFATVGAIRLGGRPGASPTPIIGSGAYRGQHGEVASAPPVKGYESVDVLHVDG